MAARVAFTVVTRAPATPPQAPERRRRRPQRALSIAAWALVALAVLPGLAYAFPALVGHDAAYVVLSGSMEPSFSPGDVVFVDRVDPASLAVGDVVTFRARQGGAVLVTHRVVEVLDDGGVVRYRTQGDANEDPDPFVVRQESIVGRHATTLPWWGLLLQLVGSKVGYFALVFLPCALVIGREFVRLYHLLDEATRARTPTPPRALALVVVALVATGALASLASPAWSASWPGTRATAALFGDGERAAGSWTADLPEDACAAAALPSLRPFDDPGFAYEDVDGDLRWTPLVDRAVRAEDLEDGAHQVPGSRRASNLVFPPSAPLDLAEDGLRLAAGADGTLLIAADLAAEDDVRLSGGAVELRGVAVVSRGGGVTLDAGRADLAGRVDAKTKVAYHAEDDATFRDHAVVSRDGAVDVVAGRVAGRLDVASAGKVGLAAGSVDLARAALSSAEDKVDVRAEGRARLPCAELAAKDEVRVDGANVALAEASIASREGRVFVTAPAGLDGARLRAEARLDVALDAPNGPLTIGGAVLASATGRVDVVSGASLDAPAADVGAWSGVAFDADGDVDVRGARLVVEDGDVEIDAGRADAVVRVEGAAFEDRDDVALVGPSGVRVEGAPASGGVAT